MVLDYIYEQSVPLIQNLQSRFSENENFFNAISQISDPAYAFNIIIPILSTFNTILTADILMVSVIAEWSNVILKWLIREDRPYWWIREFHENKKGYPYLKQGPLTCETGPGSPSGHVMGSAAILYVLVKACIRFYSARNEKNERKIKGVKYTFWAAYIIIILLVSVSRMYIGTHFAHQCLVGGILGFLIGYYFGNSDSTATCYWHKCSKVQLLSFVMSAAVTSIVAYWLQKAFGIDPQWSIKMAFKWCERIENVRVNTTPLFSLVRDTGLGLGMVSISPLIQKVANRHNLLVSMACVLVYCTALHLAQLAIPTHDVKIFYLCHALLFSTLPYVLIHVMPQIATVKRKVR